MPTTRSTRIVMCVVAGLFACERVETDDGRELAPAVTDSPAIMPPDSPLAAATEPPPDPARDEAMATCTNTDVGYRLEYPADWHTNAGDVMAACSLFDPRPIRIEPATEIPSDIAVAIRREPVAFDRIVDAPGRDEVSRDETRVDGRGAIRMESLAEEPAMLPPGTRSYRYFVDLDGATLVAATHDVGDQDFAAKRRALDRIMGSLQFTGSR